MKPLPVPDERSAGFWNATTQHRLAIQRCEHCGHYEHPPAVVCPACGNAEPRFKFEPVSGQARVHTWTIIRRPFIPAFQDDAPWVMVMGELAEQPGLRLLARLADGPEAKLKIGAPLVIAFEQLAPGTNLPIYRLAGANRP